MKIAIASDDGVTVAEHFGRTRGFVVVEVENQVVKSSEYRENTFTNHSMGKEGTDSDNPHSTIISALSDCKAVISRGIGRRLLDDLTSYGIKAFITDELVVNKVIGLYLSGNLQNLSDLACDH